MSLSHTSQVCCPPTPPNTPLTAPTTPGSWREPSKNKTSTPSEALAPPSPPRSLIRDDAVLNATEYGAPFNPLSAAPNDQGTSHVRWVEGGGGGGSESSVVRSACWASWCGSTSYCFPFNLPSPFPLLLPPLFTGPSLPYPLSPLSPTLFPSCPPPPPPSIIDGERNAVALTTTINTPYGSAVTSPSTGMCRGWGGRVWVLRV